MKTSPFAFIAAVFLLAVSCPAQKAQTYTGAIMDSQCASLGGHENMANPGEKDKDCTERCVEMGGAYALFNADTKTAYQLDDQKKAAHFGGVNVRVTGTLDTATNTIKVADIKLAS